MPLIPGNLLNENNQSFETSVTGWTGFTPGSSSVVQSSEQAKDGTFSAKATSNGSAPEAMLGCTQSAHNPVVSGSTSYVYTGWVYTPVSSTTFRLDVDWYQSDNLTFTGSNSGSNVSPSPNTWTKLTLSATSPAGSGKARLYVRHVSGLSSGQVVYFDRAFFGTSEPVDVPAGDAGVSSTSFQPVSHVSTRPMKYRRS